MDTIRKGISFGFGLALGWTLFNIAVALLFGIVRVFTSSGVSI